jgi:predicted hydrocarbon binding protein
MSDLQSREKAVAAGASYEYALPIFIFECAVNVFKVVLGEEGLNRTIEASKRYNDPAARAALDIVKEKVGQQGSDLETIAITEYYVHCCTSMGHIKPLEIREGGAVAELYACPTPGMKAPPEICVAMSHVHANAYCQVINPNYEFVFTHHLANGDDCCRWVVRKKASKFSLDNLGRLEKTIPLKLSEEEMWMFAARFAVYLQLFNFTSVSNDLIGSQRTLELVAPLARETGLRLGMKLKGGACEKGDLSMVKEKFDFLGSILQHNGTTSVITDSSIEREITGCPCKGAPPEVCKQFEGVFNGVCEAINPDYEFVYDRMMSNGLSSCHWTIRKKAEAKPKVEGTADDPAKILALRLSRGEITLEEFERTIASLKKHGVA